jgi:hypothetical protein
MDWTFLASTPGASNSSLIFLLIEGPKAFSVHQTIHQRISTPLHEEKPPTTNFAAYRVVNTSSQLDHVDFDRCEQEP